MFCNQCEQTAKGTGCTIRGVCGKLDIVAGAQDALVQSLRLLAAEILKSGKADQKADDLLLAGLFSTLTNVNFDAVSLKKLIGQVLDERNALKGVNSDTAAETEKLLATAPSPDKFAEDADVRSAMQIILFGLKGVSAYAYHAARLGKRDHDMVLDMCRLLTAAADDGTNRGLNDWLGLALDCGKANVRAMQLLDAGNTETFGDPEPTTVSTGHRKGHCILVSGHDLPDLYEILKQTEGKGINVYTHGEMLPAHAYPKLKAFPHFAGNFGTAWQNQQKEFDNIPAPVLFTTNCLMPVKESYKDRVFTTEVVSYPEMVHIEGDGEEKDFTPVINKALELGGYKEDKENTGINGGKYVVTGFGHGSVLSVADKIIEAVENKQISHFFLVGGCDGAKVGRNYYTEFVKQSPKDSVILTLACGKYRFNDLDLGEICGLPRIMDMGQCNDAYGAIKVAIALSKAFGCEVNELPLSMILSWYEQKAVCILLTLLHLGIKNIFLGPTLPAFISPNVLKYLVENYNISPISTPEADLKKILG